MGFTAAVRSALSKYIQFSGRASRSEYWYFILFVFLGQIIFGLLDGILFARPLAAQGPYTSTAGIAPLSNIFALAVLIPSLSAGWRRMHDSGRSGLYLLYPIIAMIGIVGFAALASGVTPLLNGHTGEMIAGGLSLTMLAAALVLLISPLLVIWWLTRPSQKTLNNYGPPPNEVTQ